MFLMSAMTLHVRAHEINFCGERIPVQERFVAEKLMNIIKQQMRYGMVSLLRKKWALYLAIIEDVLRKTGLPEDFKYLPVIESGFNSELVSRAGAAGYWQLMPETAKNLGLTVNSEVDERKNFDKSTYTACRVLADSYLDIKRKFGFSSWVLTAAAYNFGIGNVRQLIKKQGKNFFEMELNKETAEYVYKIVAVKELFEYPELYIGNFGYNVFNSANDKGQGWGKVNAAASDFEKVTVSVNTADGNHPEQLTKRAATAKKPETVDGTQSKWISGYISGSYDQFKDGDPIKIELSDDLEIDGAYTSKGLFITGKGWLVDGKVYIDLGHGRKLIMYDYTHRIHDGLAISSLRDQTSILMKQTGK